MALPQSSKLHIQSRIARFLLKSDWRESLVFRENVFEVVKNEPDGKKSILTS